VCQLVAWVLRRDVVWQRPPYPTHRQVDLPYPGVPAALLILRRTCRLLHARVADAVAALELRTALPISSHHHREPPIERLQLGDGNAEGNAAHFVQ